MKAVAGLAITVLIFLSAPWLCAQNLADVARQTREAERTRARRVITNDDIPPVNVMRPTEAEKSSESKAEATEKDPAKSDASKTDAAQKGEAKPEAKAEAGKTEKAKTETKAATDEKTDADRLREQQELIEKFARQQEKVSLMERELKLSQREHDQQTLMHNNDVNARTNGQAQWTSSENRFQDDYSEKQDKLNSARQRLEELQENARRSGTKLPD